MAKVTAVIDIGSNSARMAVYERTSRFGFRVIKESKSHVRISENAWKNGGELQIEAMIRAENAIAGFAQIAHSFGARKIVAVATSAVRDAPNRADFIRQIYQKTGIKIKVISGLDEALFAGTAALNLLPIEDAIAIDIGGGSTELILIKNHKIVDMVSLNLGTVRLKELFFDEEPKIKEAIRFIKQSAKSLPDHFRSNQIIGVGGTLRALAEVVMKEESYPLNIIHAYRFHLDIHKSLLKNIITSQPSDIKKLGFKSERVDVIREGILIFSRLAKKVTAKEAMISGVGVREGVFLRYTFLKNSQKLPRDFCPSLRALVDKFGVESRQADHLKRTVSRLFDELLPLHGLDNSFKKVLQTTAKIVSIGEYIAIYNQYKHSSYIALNALTYGFEHRDRVLVAELIDNMHKKDIANYTAENGYKRLLPSAVTIKWLSFILLLAISMQASRDRADHKLTIKDQELIIEIDSHLAKESIARIKPPFNLEIVLI